MISSTTGLATLTGDSAGAPSLAPGGTMILAPAFAVAIAPDGKGLPAGKGDYAAGKRVYETACAACHGANLQGVAGLPNMPAGASA